MVKRIVPLRSPSSALLTRLQPPVLDAGGSDGHSIFASALFEALDENRAVIDMSQMFGFIRRQVALAADQTPEYGDIRRAGHDGGDFLFVRVH